MRQTVSPIGQARFLEGYRGLDLDSHTEQQHSFRRGQVIRSGVVLVLVRQDRTCCGSTCPMGYQVDCTRRASEHLWHEQSGIAAFVYPVGMGVLG